MPGIDELILETDQIRDCIERADDAAASDEDFLRLLNELYVASGGTEGPPRRRGGSRSATPPVRSPASDPRYARNARELARRALGGPRVVGGQPVPKGAFLDCVAVGSGSMWGCTGTLIAPDVVITAGHCAAFASRVFFGSEVPNSGEAPSAEGVVVAVRQAIPQPGYQAGAEKNDLMVLLLERAVNVEPRRIASPALVDAAPFGRVIGFGNTDAAGTSGYGTKLWVDVPIASPGCSGDVDGQADTLAYGCHLGMEIVAGKPLLAKDSCTGDSGGPFYIDAGGGDWYVAGATSRATNKAVTNCGDGGIYVRLEAYRDWIAGLDGVTLP